MTKPPTTGHPLPHNWHQLTDLVDSIHERQGVPCRTGDTVPVGYWTSDDPQDQHEAAQGCASCAALGACKDYGLTNSKESGVFGGMTEKQRRAHPKRRTN